MFFAPDLVVPEGYGYDGDTTSATFRGLYGAHLSFDLSVEADYDYELLKDPRARAQDMIGDGGVEVFTLDVPPAKLEARDGATRQVWTLHATSDGVELDGLLVAWRCNEGRYGITGWYVALRGESLDVGREALLSAVCPGPDSPGVAAYPTAEEVFAAACRAGDERGCVELGDAPMGDAAEAAQ